MRKHEQPRAKGLAAGLRGARRKHKLTGIKSAATLSCLVEQLIESLRRVDYVTRILSRDVCDQRADPHDARFDPLKAAIWFERQGDRDEAFWMVFLFTHFGKHLRTNYRLAAAVYGSLGGSHWTWQRVRQSPTRFRSWLRKNQSRIAATGGRFGNHRKYISLDADKPWQTGLAFESYVSWIGKGNTHDDIFGSALDTAEGDPREAFGLLYSSLRSVASFGRTARFDYLCMIGKLALCPIEADSPRLTGATGPLAGTRLLTGREDSTPAALDTLLSEIADYVGVGMNVIEDAICNWQKSPDRFIPFRG